MAFPNRMETFGDFHARQWRRRDPSDPARKRRKYSKKRPRTQNRKKSDDTRHAANLVRRIVIILRKKRGSKKYDRSMLQIGGRNKKHSRKGRGRDLRKKSRTITKARSARLWRNSRYKNRKHHLGRRNSPISSASESDLDSSPRRGSMVGE